MELVAKHGKTAGVVKYDHVPGIHPALFHNNLGCGQVTYHLTTSPSISEINTDLIIESIDCVKPGTIPGNPHLLSVAKVKEYIGSLAKISDLASLIDDSDLLQFRPNHRLSIWRVGRGNVMVNVETSVSPLAQHCISNILEKYYPKESKVQAKVNDQTLTVFDLDLGVSVVDKINRLFTAIDTYEKTSRELLADIACMSYTRNIAGVYHTPFLRWSRNVIQSRYTCSDNEMYVAFDKFYKIPYGRSCFLEEGGVS